MSRTSIPVRDKFNVKQCQSPHQMSKEGGKQATSRPQRYVVVKSTAQIRRTSEDVVPLYLSTQARASATEFRTCGRIEGLMCTLGGEEVQSNKADRQTARSERGMSNSTTTAKRATESDRDRVVQARERVTRGAGACAPSGKLM